MAAVSTCWKTASRRLATHAAAQGAKSKADAALFFGPWGTAQENYGVYAPVYSRLERRPSYQQRGRRTGTSLRKRIKSNHSHACGSSMSPSPGRAKIWACVVSNVAETISGEALGRTDH